MILAKFSENERKVDVHRFGPPNIVNTIGYGNIPALGRKWMIFEEIM